MSDNSNKKAITFKEVKDALKTMYYGDRELKDENITKFFCDCPEYDDKSRDNKCVREIEEEYPIQHVFDFYNEDDYDSPFGLGFINYHHDETVTNKTFIPNNAINKLCCDRESLEEVKNYEIHDIKGFQINSNLFLDGEIYDSSLYEDEDIFSFTISCNLMGLSFYDDESYTNILSKTVKNLNLPIDTLHNGFIIHKNDIDDIELHVYIEPEIKNLYIVKDLRLITADYDTEFYEEDLSYRLYGGEVINFLESDKEIHIGGRIYRIVTAINIRQWLIETSSFYNNVVFYNLNEVFWFDEYCNVINDFPYELNANGTLKIGNYTQKKPKYFTTRVSTTKYEFSMLFEVGNYNFNLIKCYVRLDGVLDKETNKFLLLYVFNSSNNSYSYKPSYKTNGYTILSPNGGEQTYENENPTGIRGWFLNEMDFIKHGDEGSNVLTKLGGVNNHTYYNDNNKINFIDDGNNTIDGLFDELRVSYGSRFFEIWFVESYT